jgi:Flp pilus assembly protein TadD
MRPNPWIPIGLSVCWIIPIPSTMPSSPSAPELRQQGLQLRQQGDMTGAIAALQQAVELQPNHLNGRVLLGWTLHKSGDRERATQELLDVTRGNPFHIEAWNALGIVDLVSGNVHSAIASHGWAALLKPNNEIAHYNLSLAFHRLQDYDRAILHAERAAQLEPENPHPWIALAIAQGDKGDRSQARYTLQKGFALNPQLQAPSFLQIDLQEAGFSAAQIEVANSLIN